MREALLAAIAESNRRGFLLHVEHEVKAPREHHHARDRILLHYDTTRSALEHDAAAYVRDVAWGSFGCAGVIARFLGQFCRIFPRPPRQGRIA